MAFTEPFSARRPILFGLPPAAPCAEAIGARTGVDVGRVEVRPFERGEHKSRALEDVRGRPTAVVAALHGEVEGESANDRLLRLWLFVGSLKDAGAAGVTVIAPYLPYVRKDRRTHPGDPLNARYVAQLTEAAGCDRLVVVEPHNLPAFENAFRIPTLPLPLAPLVAAWVGAQPGLGAISVVSPDVGGAKRAQELVALLAARGRPAAGLAFVEKRRIRDVVSGGALVGEVAGHTCLIVDDLVASGGTLVRAAQACRAAGARAVLAAVAHALFLPDGTDTLAGAGFDRLLVTDSVPVPDVVAGALPVEVLPLADYLAGALRCAWFGESLGSLTGLGA